MHIQFLQVAFYVICRIGSLEILCAKEKAEETVICRIGSLEIVYPCKFSTCNVICRIGRLYIS